MTLKHNKALLRWLDNIIDYDGLEAVNGGMSGATIYRLKGPQDCIMKVKHNDLIGELTYEMEMYAFLKRRLPVPKTIYFGEFQDWTIHIMTELSGQVFEDRKDTWSKERFIQTYGLALKDFHQLPFEDCCIDHNIHRRLGDAMIRFQWMDGQELCPYFDYVDKRMKRLTKREIYDFLKSNIPTTTQVAVTHGDYCFDNMIEEEGLIKYLDLGRGGLADIYQDIALAVRNIHEDFGYEALTLFFEAYGLDTVDYEKINYYILLDELF